jgi:hypothetical protein
MRPLSNQLVHEGFGRRATEKRAVPSGARGRSAFALSLYQSSRLNSRSGIARTAAMTGRQ